mgnify:CR=1 FL=1
MSRIKTYILAACVFLTGSLSSAQVTGSIDKAGSLIVRVWESTIDYRVNESVLDTAYMANGLALSRIDSLAAGMKADVDSIIILGTASPEGNPEHNLKLADSRVSTFRDYLVGRYPQLDSAAVRTRKGRAVKKRPLPSDTVR